MSNSIEDQIKLVEKLRNDAKTTEALDLIEKIEGSPDLSEENLLSCLNLKGELHIHHQKYPEAIELSKKAHESLSISSFFL